MGTNSFIQYLPPKITSRLFQGINQICFTMYNKEHQTNATMTLIFLNYNYYHDCCKFSVVNNLIFLVKCIITFYILGKMK